jgi:hypothetical protein
MASGENLPILKEALVELTLGQSPNLGFSEEIMDKFILGLDVLCAYNAFIDLGYCVLHVTRTGRGINKRLPGTIKSYVGL